MILRTHDDVREEVQGTQNSAIGNYRLGRPFMDFFMKKDPTGKEVVLLAKRYIDELRSAASNTNNKMLYNQELANKEFEAITLGIVFDARVFNDVPQALRDSYERLARLLEDRRSRLKKFVGNEASQVKVTRNFDPKIKKELSKFRANYKRYMAKINKPVTVVSNAVTVAAKKLKIRLTKNVNGKRVKRTEQELKNAIANAKKKKT